MSVVIQQPKNNDLNIWLEAHPDGNGVYVCGRLGSLPSIRIFHITETRIRQFGPSTATIKPELPFPTTGDGYFIIDRASWADGGTRG